MKVLIVGAGGQGGPCASILARDNTVEEIRLVDINGSVAETSLQKSGKTRSEPV